MNHRRLHVAAVASALLLSLSACGSESAKPAEFSASSATIVGRADFEYTIPLGSAQRADAGEHLLIFPSRLQARVGQTIRIVNQDDRTHIVGPFSVGPGQTLTQRFASAGTFEGECTTHPDSPFVLEVAP